MKALRAQELRRERKRASGGEKRRKGKERRKKERHRRGFLPENVTLQSQEAHFVLITHPSVVVLWLFFLCVHPLSLGRRKRGKTQQKTERTERVMGKKRDLAAEDSARISTQLDSCVETRD